MEIKKLELQTLDFIKEKFADKVDKGGHPYINHLYSVASKIEHLGSIKTDWFRYDHSSLCIFYHKAYIVALLHDILEDTDTTEQDLRDSGYDDEIIEAVKSLTRKNGENYFDFIIRASKNDIGKLVKKYDLEDNMDIRRLSEFGEYEMQRLKKYWYSWMYLKGEKNSTEVHNILYPNEKWR